MRMRMLVSIAGYIGGELGAVQPGGIYTAVSENEAKALYRSNAAVPESGEIPPSWNEPGDLVSPETDLVPATIAPAEVPGMDDPTDVLQEPILDDRPAAAVEPAKPKRPRKNAAAK